jgi:hypothetical protein
VLDLYPEVALLLVKLVGWVSKGVQGGYREKTYLSMRYSFRPSTDSNLNFSGYDSSFYLNWFRGDFSYNLLVSLQQFIQ